MFLEQPVEAGHADVVEAVNGISHQLRGDRGFFGYREICGTGRGNNDRPASTGCRPLVERNTPRELVIGRPGDHGRDELVRFSRCAGDEQVVSPADQAFGYRGDLVWRFSEPEDHFGETLPGRAVMVDARETEIFEWPLAQNLKEAVLRGLRCYVTAAHLVEKGPQLLPVHRGKCLEIVDFATTSTVT